MWGAKWVTISVRPSVTKLKFFIFLAQIFKQPVSRHLSVNHSVLVIILSEPKRMDYRSSRSLFVRSAEVCLSSRLAQAKKWTESKDFDCSCNLYFLVGALNFQIQTVWTFLHYKLVLILDGQNLIQMAQKAQKEKGSFKRIKNLSSY